MDALDNYNAAAAAADDDSEYEVEEGEGVGTVLKKKGGGKGGKAAGPSVTSTARKYCSVCGYASNYNCARCGMKFCSRKCNAVHTETRCLKFTA